MFHSFAKHHSVRVLIFALAFAGLASWATSRSHLLSNPFVAQAALPVVTADVGITNTASPGAGVANGSQMTYMITVSNSGPDTATDATVNDPLPAGTTFVSVAPSQGSCSAPAPGNNGTVNCSLGSIPAPGSATITLVVTFTAAPGSAISNTVTVSTTSVDMNMGNDSATSATMVAQTTCAPVTNNADSGIGSLRATIVCANSTPGLDAITFNIPGGGVHTIALLSPLPFITSPVFIDGYTQPGASPNTLSIGDDAVLAIELNGASAGVGPSGLTINSTASGSTVRGLVINRFSAHGVNLNGASGNRIEGNFIGTNAAGNAALKNGQDGVQISQAVPGGGGASNNTIGGPTAAARNIISGNGTLTSPPVPTNGVDIRGNTSTGNVVQGNYIGTDVTGSFAIPNLSQGVAINDAVNNLIVGNVSSGNGSLQNLGPPAGIVAFGNGVAIFSFSPGGGSGNQVQGNFLGTNAAGTVAIPNIASGLSITGGSNNTIGGTTTVARNIISGNKVTGISIDNNSNTPGNLVQGNYIGTKANGAEALPNGVNPSNSGNGVAIGFGGGGSNNIIGGTTPGAGNLISGNIANGVRIQGGGSTGNLIQGNLIGTKANGTESLGNGSSGVSISAPNNTIGGPASDARNIISGNTGVGVFVTFASRNNILGNYIGTDTTGSVSLGNFHRGVMLSSASVNTIQGNLISGNNGTGLSLENGSNSNQVQGNLIGTKADGTNALGNSQFGVLIDRASTNNITMNTIAFNGSPSSGAGVLVGTFDPGSNTNGVASGNAIRQNSIFSNQGLGIDLYSGNPFGVTPNDSCDTDTGANNFQNFPVLTGVSSSGGNTTIQGTLNSAPGTTFTIEFFSNVAADPSGSGEGQTYLGSTTVTTGADCNAAFSFAFPDNPGQPVITATATDPLGNTSEFSAWVLTTTTTLTSDNNPSTYGQAVTFTATVSSGAGAPTGTVTFKDGATTLGTGTLNGSGQATFTTSSLSAGTHSITAVFEGGSNYLSSSSGAFTQTVNQAGTTTTLASSNNPSTYEQGVTFTATVTSGATGTVTFKDGATTLGTGTVDGSGQATFTTSSLSAGTHSITAVYGGDANFNGSTSAATAQIVNQASTSTALTSNANPSTYGQPVTFTATVTSVGGTPTGTVTFRDGATVLAIVAVDGSGQATYSTSSLFIGVHSITSTYNGDANFTGSASAAVIQTVVTPLSTESVKVNGGGFITLATGGNGSFGLVGMVSKTDVASGNVEYQDHDAGLNIKSTTITAVVVTGNHARMFGTATVNGAGSFDFVVDVDDFGEPGAGVDKFRIQLSNGYTAGAALISGGNIQVHN